MQADKFIGSGEIVPRVKKGAQNPPNLTGAEFEIIEFLKRDSLSMPLAKNYDVVDAYCGVPSRILKAAISRAITKRMWCGPTSWKQTSNRPINKFSLEKLTIAKTFLTTCHRWSLQKKSALTRLASKCPMLQIQIMATQLLVSHVFKSRGTWMRQTWHFKFLLVWKEYCTLIQSMRQQLHLIFLNFSARHQIISHQTGSQFFVIETISW